MNRPVLIETSARHIHVSRKDLDILFGEGYELTKKKDLSQPGQYACEERVQVIGPKGSFPGVSILGPERPETQVVLFSICRCHMDMSLSDDYTAFNFDFTLGTNKLTAAAAFKVT